MLFHAVNYHGWHGSEMRALSAFDLALWDIAGKAAGQPVYMLLGGACRDSIPVYNACVSHADIRDHEAFLQDPGGLARSLLAEGLRVLKIWPFDAASAATGGHYAGGGTLSAGLRVLESIRNAVGRDIDIGVEAHGCWDLAAAKVLARELERFGVLFLEEPMPPDNAGAMARLAASTSIPICGSERLFTRFALKPFLDAGALDIVMMDPIMVGGITEWGKCAVLADTYQLPVMAHACNGPVTFTAAAHLCAHVPNLYLMEFVRSFYHRWYGTIAAGFPEYGAGTVRLPQGPGLGVTLQPAYAEDPAMRREKSEGAAAAAAGFAAGDPWQGNLGDSL
jgi:L-alanine-DL-glutamate epimerase-like enolase superfamily enzyme